MAVLPYMIELVGSSIFGHAAAPDMSMSTIVTLALVQNGILLAVASWFRYNRRVRYFCTPRLFKSSPHT